MKKIAVILSIGIFLLLLVLVIRSNMSSTEDIYFDDSEIEFVEVLKDDNTLLYTLENPVLIKRVFSDYINTNSKSLRKFKPTMKLSFNYKGDVVVLLLNSEYMKYQGISYRLSKDIDVYLTELSMEN